MKVILLLIKYPVYCIISSNITAIIPILAWGFRDRIKLGKLARILHLHDPLLGSPSWIKDKRRIYEFRSQLPSLDLILEIKNLTRIDILSISSYTITLEYIESIKKTLNS
jgi:hypothetical protein